MVRVLPDVGGLGKAFDYEVPPEMATQVEVGTSVRVLLHNRSVAGWVVADDVEPPPGVSPRPLSSVRGLGPPPAVVSLAQWAAWRWAGPPSRLLRTASSPVLVRALPPTRRRAGAGDRATSAPPGEGDPAGALAGEALAGAATVVRLAPAHDPFALVQAACRRVTPDAGCLVLVPEHRRAGRLADRLRQAGHEVALLPDEWARARAGGVVAVGTRAAAFAPLPALVAAVVTDAHDEAYYEERAPTWCAWEVVVERARREGAPCALVSACPTLDLLEGRPVVTGARADALAGWPRLEVVDRRGDDPRTGLYSERLVELLRQGVEHGARSVCVLNRTGRVRLLACAACGELQSCPRCGGALHQADAGLACRRCSYEQPAVCNVCGSTRLRALRLGVSRVRQDLEALLRVPVAEVSGAEEAAVDPSTTVIVGTEAVLHRVGRAETVAFLDFDAELLAPRLRAGEEALALLARAGRVVSGARWSAPGRARGRVVVQTRQPRHPVVLAAQSADPGALSAVEAPIRAELGLPPFRAQALVSGEAAEVYGAELADVAPPGVEVRGPSEGTWSVLAPDHEALADLLGAVPRPAGRLRVEVDPVRA